MSNAKGTLKEALDKAKAKQVAFIKRERKKRHSYADIAAKLGLSRQRIQQIDKANP